MLFNTLACTENWRHPIDGCIPLTMALSAGTYREHLVRIACFIDYSSRPQRRLRSLRMIS